jgi:flagellar motility protein MotE (MotC chaperone)
MMSSRQNTVSGFLLPGGANLGLAFIGVILFAVHGVPANAESLERQPRAPAFAVSESGARALELRATALEPKVILAPFHVAADDTKPVDAKKEDAKDSEALPVPAPTVPELSPAQQYCSSILDTATAAQIAQQTRNLEKAQKQLDERIALLAAKADILKKWIKMREDFTARVADSLVQIYTKMKPDAAASQITAMDEVAAAAIMSKLSPKASSPIMAEMEPAKAARLSAIMVGAGDIGIGPQPERKADAQQ